MNRQRLPLLPVLAGLIAGIVLCFQVTVPWIVIPFLLMALACAIYLNRFYFSAVIFAAMFGIAVCKFSLPEDLPTSLEGEKVTYRGAIEEISESSTGERIIVSIPDLKSKALLNLFEFETGYEPGDEIEFTTTLTAISFKPDLPDERDYRKFYRTKGIVSRGYVAPDDIRIIGKARGIRHLVNSCRNSLYRTIEASDLSDGSKNFIKALILGDPDNIGKVQRAGFTSAGLAHILALSGTHVAIICSFIFFIFMPFGKIVSRNTTYVLSLLVLWCYTLLTGLSPSVIRASIMISTILIARMTSRRPNGLNALLFAALVILVFNPAALFTPSFQLSFSAVAAILIFGRYFNHSFMRGSLMNRIAALVMVSIAAMSGTGLIAAYYFHTFPIYFIFSNIPAAILVPMFIWAGLICLLLEITGIHLPIVTSLTDRLHDSIIGIADHFAALPGSTIGDIYFTAWVFVPFAFFVLFAITYLSKRKRIHLSLTVLSLGLCAALIVRDNRKTDENTVYFTGNSYGTEIILVQGTKCNVYTTRSNENTTELLKRLTEEYHDFFAKRGIKEIEYLHDGMNIGNVSREGNSIKASGKTIHILDRENPEINSTADYYIVTRGISYKELEKMTREWETASLILPKEMNSRTERHFKELLEKRPITYHSLRENPLKINF